MIKRDDVGKGTFTSLKYSLGVGYDSQSLEVLKVLKSFIGAALSLFGTVVIWAMFQIRT